MHLFHELQDNCREKLEWEVILNRIKVRKMDVY